MRNVQYKSMLFTLKMSTPKIFPMNIPLKYTGVVFSRNIRLKYTLQIFGKKILQNSFAQFSLKQSKNAFLLN